jgi:hypothetical protein
MNFGKVQGNNEAQKRKSRKCHQVFKKISKIRRKPSRKCGKNHTS